MQPSGFPSSQPSSNPTGSGFTWTISIDSTIDTPDTNDNNCNRHEWLNQVQSNRCNIRDAIQFCLRRAPFIVGDMVCKFIFMPNSLYFMRYGPLELLYPIQTVSEERKKYSINLLFLGEGSILKTSSNERFF